MDAPHPTPVDDPLTPEERKAWRLLLAKQVASTYTDEEEAERQAFEDEFSRYSDWRERSTPQHSSLKSEPSALVGVEEAAQLLGIRVEALRSRVKRGQVPKECILRTGGRREKGQRGGNSGRLQFWRSRLMDIGQRQHRK